MTRVRSRRFTTCAIVCCLASMLACSNGAGKGDAGQGGTGGTALGGSGTGGAAGTTAAAGTGGTAGTTAAGTGGAGGGTSVQSWEDLPCLQKLFAQCPLDGACKLQYADGGNEYVACYPSGVTVSKTSSSFQCAASDPNQTEEQIRKPDGSLCYTVKGTLLGCETHQTTWIDGTGTVVAGGSYGFYPADIRCFATGEFCRTGTGGLSGGSSEPCRATGPPSPVCTPGTCP